MVMILVIAFPVFVGAVLSGLAALRLLRRNDASHRYLLAFMVVATLFQISHFLFFNQVRCLVPAADTAFSFTLPALFVFYYYYIDSLTTTGRRTWAGWLSLLPSVVCLVAVEALYLAMGPEDTDVFVEGLYGAETAFSGRLAWQWLAHKMVIVVFIIQIGPVVWITLKRIRSYNDSVSKQYSDTDDKIVGQVFPPLFFIFFVFIVALTCLFVSKFVLVHNNGIIYSVSIAFSLLLLLIGDHALERRFSFLDMAREEAQEEVQQPAAEPQVDETVLRKRVVHAIKTEKLFLQPNLKISDLARHLHTNRSYIYNVVNVEMGISFAELVNRERVAFAVELMRQQPSLLLADVAVRSGFSSNVSFYRNFKKYQNCSPKEFQQQLSTDD